MKSIEPRLQPNEWVSEWVSVDIMKNSTMEKKDVDVVAWLAQLKLFELWPPPALIRIDSPHNLLALEVMWKQSIWMQNNNATVMMIKWKKIWRPRCVCE